MRGLLAARDSWVWVNVTGLRVTANESAPTCD